MLYLGTNGVQGNPTINKAYIKEARARLLCIKKQTKRIAKEEKQKSRFQS